MTITINVPQETEPILRAEAARTGLAVQQLIERVVVERFDAARQSSTETAQEFFDRLARTGPVVDTSRENIYADI